MNQEKIKQLLFILRNCFIGFTIVCFITYLTLSWSVKINTLTLSSASDTIKVVADHNRQTFKIEMKTNLVSSYNEWSYYSFDVLDEEKEYEFTFEREFWAETGYESDGVWREDDLSMTYHIVRENKGPFYLVANRLETNSDVNQNIQVEINRQTGSSLAFIWISLISFVLIFGFHYLSEYLHEFYAPKNLIDYD